MSQLYEKNKEVIFIASLLCFMSYGFWAFNSIFSGDDWFGVIHGTALNDDYIAAGRWMNNVFGYLTFDRLFAPGFSTFFMMAALVLSSLLFAEHLPIKDKTARIFFCSFFCVFPLWIEVFNFKQLHINIGVTILMTVGSFVSFKYFLLGYIQNKKQYLYLILSALLMILSVSTYQTYFFFFWIALLIYLRYEYQQPDNKFVGKLPQLIIALVLFHILFGVGYVIGIKSIAYFFGRPLSEEGLYDIASPLHLSNMGKQISDTFQRMLNFLYKPQFLFPPLTKLAILISILLSLVFSIIKKKKVLLNISCILAIYTIPWVLGFIRDGFIHYRYNALTPLVLTICYLLIFPLENNYLKSWGKKIYQGLLIFSLFVFCFTNSGASYALYLSNQRDILFGQQFLTHLHSMDEYEAQKTYLIRMYGSPKMYLENKRPFQVSDYNNPRGYNIMRVSAIEQIRLLPHLLYLISSEKFTAKKNIGRKQVLKQLPEQALNSVDVWPAKNSVKILNDNKTVVIFFSKLDIETFK